MASVIQPVSVGPGSSAFTVMPRAATSTASVRVNASTAPLVAAYANSSGIAPSPCPDERLMIRPSVRSGHRRANSTDKRAMPRTLTA